jgi:hypothetical protein
MSNMTASATGGTNNIGVVMCNSSSTTMTNSTVSGTGGTGNYGMSACISSSAVVNNSQIIGGTNTIINSASTVRVGGSQLSGGPVFGTVTCAGVYDENYAFYASTCP